MIIAQELVHSIGKSKGKEGYMVVKIELEKAYDRLEWSFIKLVRTHFGFPDNIIQLILNCVSSTSTSLLFNGSKLPAFYPSRGIRQGDPISPYLFILCMEFLGAQITKMCEEKRWDMIKPSRQRPSFSHVFFVDDIMLFAKANAKNCEAILEVFDSFCSMAGQKINYGKSRVFFSPNVTARRKRGVCRRLGIMATNNLGRYLGFPIIHKGKVVVLSILFWIKFKASLLVGKQSFCQEQVDLWLLNLQWLLLQIITCNAIAFLLKFVILLTR